MNLNQAVIELLAGSRVQTATYESSVGWVDVLSIDIIKVRPDRSVETATIKISPKRDKFDFVIDNHVSVAG